MKNIILYILLISSVAAFSQNEEESEKAESSNSLSVQNLLNPDKEYITVISYNELPSPIKTTLKELNILTKNIQNIRVLELNDRVLYALSILEDDQLKTLRFKPNGQMENS
jgi:hypothetical protein